MEIDIDKWNPNGSGYKIGPYYVEREDLGKRLVKNADGVTAFVYTEVLGVRVGERLIQVAVDVLDDELDRYPAQYSRTRMAAAMKGLEDLRIEILRHHAGGLQL
jgi:hypothetical protein